MWPVYHWPNKAPVGLEDKTIVSLSWSITKAVPNTRRLLGSRRLLGLPPHDRLTGKQRFDPLAAGRVENNHGEDESNKVHGKIRDYHLQVRGKRSMRVTRPMSVTKSTRTARVATVNKTMNNAVTKTVNNTSTIIKGRALNKTKAIQGIRPHQNNKNS